MSEVAEVSALVAYIYDAALDPSLWPSVLERIVGYFRGVAAVFDVQDARLHTSQFVFSSGDDPEFTRSYFQEYVKINPLLPHFMMKEIGEVYAASQLMPYEELRQSR